MPPSSVLDPRIVKTSDDYAFVLLNHSVAIPTNTGLVHLFPALGETVTAVDFFALKGLQQRGIIRSYRYIECKSQPVFLVEACG